MRRFKVSIDECNEEKFKEDYEGYIEDVYAGFYGSPVYVMSAPSEVLQEIRELEEDGIEFI